MILPLHPRGSDWPLHASQIWIIAAIVLLCWLLAYNLTTPLRGLQKTLERFGRGDFSARSGSRRHDELGQLARTFDVMAARIETLVASQRRLLLDISHELRSPLTRLGVAVEIARAQTDPEASLNRIQREADDLGLDVVGYYHSHPDHPAQASLTDAARSFTGAVFLIVSCERGKVVDSNAFVAVNEGGPMRAEPLEVRA